MAASCEARSSPAPAFRRASLSCTSRTGSRQGAPTAERIDESMWIVHGAWLRTLRLDDAHHHLQTIPVPRCARAHCALRAFPRKSEGTSTAAPGQRCSRLQSNLDRGRVASTLANDRSMLQRTPLETAHAGTPLQFLHECSHTRLTELASLVSRCNLYRTGSCSLRLVLNLERRNIWH